MSAKDRARSLSIDLSRSRVGVLRPLVLVAHSMGGVIGKHLLLERKGKTGCAAVVFMGVPHRGSVLADALAGIGLGRDMI